MIKKKNGFVSGWFESTKRWGLIASAMVMIVNSPIQGQEAAVKPSGAVSGGNELPMLPVPPGSPPGLGTNTGLAADINVVVPLTLPLAATGNPLVAGLPLTPSKIEMKANLIEFNQQLLAEIEKHKSALQLGEAMVTTPIPLKDRTELKFSAGGFTFHSPSMDASPNTSELYEAISNVLNEVAKTYQTTSKTAAREEMRNLANQLTSYLFQIQQEVRKSELNELTQRIERLRKSIATRDEQSSKIIEKRVVRLLQLDDDLDWDEARVAK